MFILKNHPEEKCPIEPLLKVISRKIWTSQQKGAQALFYALNDKTIKGQEEVLYRHLIPLLTSQRSRVYNAGANCLRKISGENIEPDADQWKIFYEKKFPEKKLDLTKTVFEIVAVIKPQKDNEKGKFEVNGEAVKDANALKAKLKGLKKLAKNHKYKLGVVIQIPNAEMQKMAQTQNFSIVQVPMMSAQSIGIQSITVSPEADVFRPPYKGIGILKNSSEPSQEEMKSKGDKRNPKKNPRENPERNGN